MFPETGFGMLKPRRSKWRLLGSEGHCVTEASDEDIGEDQHHVCSRSKFQILNNQREHRTREQTGSNCNGYNKTGRKSACTSEQTLGCPLAHSHGLYYSRQSLEKMWRTLSDISHILYSILYVVSCILHTI